jgi:outer membrane lipoprotein SlyB
MRSTFKALILAPAFVIAAACSKDKPVDPALNNDLSLAAQANANARLDSISAAERMNGTVGANGLRTGAATAPVASAPAPVHRSTATTHRSSGTRSSSGGTVASAPHTVIKKNTKRDAAIGAAAGAIIGATTSHDKVKGGIIGAAAGGILGGVIGNNVDIQKKRVP